MANVAKALLARYPGVGGDDQHLISVTGGTDYTAGGYALTPTDFSFNAFLTDGLGTGLPPTPAYWVVGQALAAGAATGFAGVPAINPTNGKLQFYDPATGAEVADATGFIAYLLAYGH
jgi:hypothetical protein